VPGDQVRFEVELLAWKQMSRAIIVRMAGKALVEGKVVCEGTVSAQLVDRNRGRQDSSAASEKE
jgi:3-hydroxymyristoyl/3-hydroxydecanoyl-(acyl carrier protein) dehydratase